MTAWNAMYLKELKELRLAGAIALILTVALDVYALSLSRQQGPPFELALLALPYLSAFFLPLLLAHALTSEWRGTHYQMLSLPVPRAVVVLTKAQAVCTLGAALFVANTATVHLVFAREVDRALQGSGFFKTDVDGWGIWSTLASVYWGILLLLGGIAVVVAATRLLVPRLKGLAAAGVTLFGLYLYGNLHGSVVALLAEILGRPATVTGFGPTDAIANAPVQFLCAALLGAAYLAVGALLFERAVEA